jgi:hypothetical protein
MKPNVFDLQQNARLIARISALTPSNERKWGTMTIDEMLCHVADQIRCSLGEKDFKPREIGMPIWLVKIVVFYLPWPKNSPTVPDFKASQRGTLPSDFESDRQALIALISRLATLPAKQNLLPHPAFGALSKRKWGQLIAGHIDWHLKQFSA